MGAGEQWESIKHQIKTVEILIEKTKLICIKGRGKGFFSSVVTMSAPSVCPFWLEENNRAAAKRHGVSLVPACIINKWEKKKWHDHPAQVLRGSSVLLSRTGEDAGVQWCVWHKWGGLLQAALVAGAERFRRNLSGLSPCKIRCLQVFSLKEYSCGLSHSIQPAASRCISQGMVHVVALAGSCPGHSAGRQHSSSLHHLITAGRPLYQPKYHFWKLENATRHLSRISFPISWWFKGKRLIFPFSPRLCFNSQLRFLTFEMSVLL